MIPAIRFTLAGLMAGILLLTGCGKNSPTGPKMPAGPATDFDEVIQAAGAFPEVQDREQVLATESSSETVNGEVYYCTKITHDVTKNFDTFPLFDPNAEVVFPGNLLQGATLSEATPSPVPVERGGGTVVVTLVNGSNGVQRQIPQVTLGNVIEAANQIVAANSGTLPARTTYSMERIGSREQLGLALNASYRNLSSAVQGSFNFRSDLSYNRFVVKLTQAYYTIAYELPTHTADFFAPGVTPADLARFVSAGNPAAFISSVTYGRIFYLLIQSTESAQAVEASIRASFNAAVSGGTIGGGAKYVSQLQSLQIGGYALGGDSQKALAALQGDLDALKRYITEGGTIRSGTPLSYVVRSVARPDQIVKVHVNTQYDEVDCIPIGESLANPIVWYSAQNGVTHVATGNDASRGVTKIANLFSNGYSAATNAPSTELYAGAYIAGGGPNGSAVVNFGYGQSYMSGRMNFTGLGFENTDYTVFAVLRAYHLGSTPNLPRWFTWGESTGPGQCLQIGFVEPDTVVVSHGGGLVLKAKTPSSVDAYRLYTVRFSRTAGLSIWVNGVLVGSNPSFTQPVQSFVGARFGTVGANRQPDWRLTNMLLDFRAFGTAASEDQRIAIEQAIRTRFAL